MTQFLLALCGIPASGKTTIARDILEATKIQWNSILVSTDDWRDVEFYSSFKPEKEGEVRKKALNLTRTLLARKQSVIHDDTNYYSSMRHELLCLAEEFECIFGIVYVKTPLDVALQWNGQRGTIIPPEVVTKIHDKFDSPGEKYAWDVPVYEVDLNRTEISVAVTEIVERLGTLQPITQKDSAKPGLMEQFDTATRRVVKEFLVEETSYRNDPAVSRIRKETLQEAIRERWSLEDTKKTLWERLNKLTI
ncbi:MAG: AAA family ATPase [Candidatus Thorarchaeota archaeon]|jgi:O-phosphoseryl-tRNA(Sec) kinase